MVRVASFIFDEDASSICYKLSADNEIHIVENIQEMVSLIRLNGITCVLISEQLYNLKSEIEGALGRKIALAIAVGNHKNTYLYEQGFLAIVEAVGNVHNYEALIANIALQMGSVDKVLNRERSLEDGSEYGLLFELVECKQSTLWALATLAETRDTDTGTHLDRVRTLSKLMCQNLDITEYAITDEFMYDVSYASILHDIGKVGISDEILYKPGELTYDEYEVMKTHSKIGCDTLDKVLSSYTNNSIISVAREIARHHHERWDGAGYPDGLAGRSIPLSARIVSLVDAYDAIRTKRIYKAAKPHTEALRLIQECTGTQFDPSLVTVLMSLEHTIETVYDSMN